ncbi:MAG TPA: cytochrome c3 family protein, partial [Anaerolineales bacterium]|nr:cytochrome c3 family protein [Anaerolineales bacterium]
MRQRLGCLSGTGLIAALITALFIAGYVYARGGLLFNPAPLNAQSGRALGGVTSHAEIGGNCESCHTAPWESEIMADRCVVCHTDIATELQSVESLHGAIMFDNPDLACRNCHPEHRGQAAPLTLIEIESFPHEAVGFSLNGHQRFSTGESFTCADCHHDDITTFTTDTCYVCHHQMDAAFARDHLSTFGNSCLACHDGVDRYGDNFDHNQFVFQLRGNHIEISCSGCHQNARTIADLQSTPQDCFSCHSQDEPHEGRFGTDCASCHTTDGWLPATFDHNLSGFPLTGRHAELTCEQCHTLGQFAGLSTSCTSCHAEPEFHAGLFGSNCAVCHSTTAWTPAKFNGQHAFP